VVALVELICSQRAKDHLVVQAVVLLIRVQAADQLAAKETTVEQTRAEMAQVAVVVHRRLVQAMAAAKMVVMVVQDQTLIHRGLAQLLLVSAVITQAAVVVVVIRLQVGRAVLLTAVEQMEIQVDRVQAQLLTQAAAAVVHQVGQ